MTESLKQSADQCYFGYTNRGHGLLCASFDNKELLIFLARVTDLPINKPADIHPGVFYGCHHFEEYLVFTKTFPDQQSLRSGMVFTHAIIIETRVSQTITDLEQLFNFFVSDIPDKKPTTLPRIALNKPNGQITTRSVEEKNLLPILYFFLSTNEDQALVIPLNRDMPKLYIQLWNALLPALRPLLTFRLAFTPVDIEPSNYQLYFTPFSLLKRWPQEMQYDNYIEPIETFSKESAKSLLANERATPFANFISELNFHISDFKGFRICELAFSYYKQINHLDAGKLVQLLRLVLRLSPAKSDGKAVKKLVVTKLAKQLEQIRTDNFLLLALANIEHSALENFLTTISPKIQGKLMLWWREGKIEFLEGVIKRRVEAPASSWWLGAIDAALEQQINNIAGDEVPLIYQLWEQAETTIFYLWSLLKTTPHYETLLVDNLPNNLDDNVFKKLLPLVKHRRWLQLHASLITQKWKPEKALEEQLAMTSDDKPSLMIIANHFTEAAFIQAAINYNSPVLQEIALGLPVEIKDLKKIFKVENEQWQEFIEVKLSELIILKKGIEFFQPIIDMILDGLVDGKHINTKLLALIATTPSANISNYPKRAEVWAKLQGSIKSDFLKATGSSLLKHLTTTANLEPILINAMISLNIVGEFMDSHSKNWSDILRIFEIFPSLPENYLADHLKYSVSIDTPNNATRLGKLIQMSCWRNCADIVYEKALYNHSYKTTLVQCVDLLDFFKKIHVKYTFTNMSFGLKMTDIEWLKNFEALCIEMYDDENEIRIIWKKAGGDVADLRSRESARVIWHHALQNMKKGKMRDITFEILLIEMMTNVPAKKEQLQMLLNAISDIQSIQ